MISLMVKNDSNKRRIDLKPGTVFIGRAKDNDVHFQDKSISAHHAKIVTYFNASYIEDLSSTNGTYINGKRVKIHTLRPGDEIALGPQRILVNA